MKKLPRTVALVCGLSAASCSSFKVEVEVYDGTGITTRPPLRETHKVPPAVSGAKRTLKLCNSQARTASERAGALSQVLRELETASVRISRTQDFVDEGKRMADAWRKLLLDELKGLAGTGATLKRVTAAFKKHGTRIGNTADYKLDGVPVASELNLRVLVALKTTEEGQIEKDSMLKPIAQSVVNAAVCKPETCNETYAKLTMALGRATSKQVAELAKGLNSAALKPETWESALNGELGKTATRVDEITEPIPVVCAPLQEPLVDLEASAASLDEYVNMGGKAKTTDSPSDELLTVAIESEVAKAAASSGRFVEAVTRAAATLKAQGEAADGVARDLVKLLKRRPLATVAIKSGQVATPSALLKSGTLNDPALLIGSTKAWAAGLAATLPIDANLRDAAQLSQPYRLTDPNLRIITDEANKDNWNDLPIDELKAHADGKGQFVVAQDGPVNYRLKELHADPQSIVELGMSIGDLAVELVGAFVGIPLGGEEDSKAAVTCDGEAVARSLERRAQELTASTARLRDKLKTQLGQVEGTGDVDLETLAEIQGSLSGYRSRLEALKAQAAAPEKTGCGESTESASPQSEAEADDDEASEQADGSADDGEQHGQ